MCMLSFDLFYLICFSILSFRCKGSIKDKELKELVQVRTLLPRVQMPSGSVSHYIAEGFIKPTWRTFTYVL